MANVLLTWELGAGLGHLVKLQMVAKGLWERGHRVAVAAKDLSRARGVFAGMSVTFLQAPTKTAGSHNAINPPRTFAHILHNTGFGSVDELETMVQAWQSLFEYVKPDLIVFDHSPTAMVAARSWKARRVQIAMGFESPQRVCPLPDLRPWLPPETDRLREEEEYVRQTVNRVFQRLNLSPIDRLCQLYEEMDETFLMTFRELDHYPDRGEAKYWGVWSRFSGKAPVWPEMPGKKVFVYLKSFPALPRLLEHLRGTGLPCLVFAHQINAAIRRQFDSPNLRFETERLDIGAVTAQCDTAILNGNHGTTAAMLMAGKPVFQVPIFLEQVLVSSAVTRLGAGLSAGVNEPEQVAMGLTEFLRSETYAANARAFAARYADFDPDRQERAIHERIDSLLS